MKIKTILVISALSSLSTMSEEKINNNDITAPGTISEQIRMVEVAGVGEFVDPPAPNLVGDLPLKIRVSEYWTDDPGTNIITITVSQRAYSGSGLITKHIPFPEHVPVVFFAVKKDPTSGRKAIGNERSNNTSVTNITDVSNLVFYPRSTAWFKKDCDNGLIYTYMTNLWDCIRVNPDKEKHYETLRNGFNFSSKKSTRVGHDTLFTLLEFVQNADEEWLAKMYADPELPQHSKSHVESLLRQKYDWDGTNDMIQPPPMTTENN